jgi:hypothetical protein
MRAMSIVSLTLVGCVAGAPSAATPPDGGEEVSTEGGSLVLPGCGTTLVTRWGATAPVMGRPVLGDDPTPVYVHLGLSADPSTSMVIQWRTDEATWATTVEYGVGAALDQTAEGATFRYVSGFSAASPLVRVHEVHLCGLTPDTVYSYRAGGADDQGSSSWSPTFQFRTAPPPEADEEIVIAVLGDTRDGYSVWRSMLQLAKTMAPDLILFSGDAVTLGPVQYEWDEFFGNGEGVLESIPMLAAHGNHDANSVTYFSLFALPGDEEYYGVDYGPVHVTVLNDTPVENGEIGGKGAQFLTDDLAAAAGRPWKLLMHHKPIWSAAANHGGDAELLAEWGPIIDEAHVDLVLNGHDHDYERTKPMRGSSAVATPAEGTIYVVAGSAGANLYTNGSDFWTELSAKSHSLLVLDVRRGLLEARAYREDGSVLDEFTISKP